MPSGHHGHAFWASRAPKRGPQHQHFENKKHQVSENIHVSSITRFVCGDQLNFHLEFSCTHDTGSSCAQNSHIDIHLSPQTMAPKKPALGKKDKTTTNGEAVEAVEAPLIIATETVEAPNKTINSDAETVEACDNVASSKELPNVEVTSELLPEPETLPAARAPGPSVPDSKRDRTPSPSSANRVTRQRCGRFYVNVNDETLKLLRQVRTNKGSLFKLPTATELMDPQVLPLALDGQVVVVKMWNDLMCADDFCNAKGVHFKELKPLDFGTQHGWIAPWLGAHAKLAFSGPGKYQTSVTAQSFQFGANSGSGRLSEWWRIIYAKGALLFREQ